MVLRKSYSFTLINYYLAHYNCKYLATNHLFI